MERGTGQFIPSEPYIPFDSTLVTGGRGDSDGVREQRFTQFSEALGRDLAPRSLLEQILADHVILAAWTMRVIAEKEHDAIRTPHSPGVARGDASGCVDVSPRDVLDVADCLGKMLELFHRLRGVTPAPASPPAPLATDVTSDFDFDSDSGPDSVTVFDLDSELDDDQLADLSNEWPIVPRGRSVEDHPDEDTGYRDRSDGGDESLAERWRGRLFFDLNVSEDSPVIKGTWVTVSQVVSLIVDGWTWSDILRTHPELSEDDIRTCLAYTVAEEDGEL